MDGEGRRKGDRESRITVAHAGMRCNEKNEKLNSSSLRKIVGTLSHNETHIRIGELLIIFARLAHRAEDGYSLTFQYPGLRLVCATATI
jgi:hypothetical protein